MESAWYLFHTNYITFFLMLLNFSYKLDILETLSMFDTYFFMVFNFWLLCEIIFTIVPVQFLMVILCVFFWGILWQSFTYRTRVSMIIIQFLVYKLILRYFRVQFQVACFVDLIIRLYSRRRQSQGLLYKHLLHQLID